MLAPLFGWKRADGRRRFDKAFVTTGKKSGKSTVLAGLPIYMMLADGELEAECYSAAVDRDQASIIYRKTARMVRESPELDERRGGLLKRIESQKRIVHRPSGSFYEAISSDADSAEGKNPHLLIADELHVWKDRQFFNALMYGDIARAQPLFLMITTAGDDPTGVGFEEYQFAKDLLDPNNDFYSESHFAFIADAGAERLSDHRYLANLFRLYLHTATYNLLVRLRRLVADLPAPPRVVPDLPVEARSPHQKRCYFNRRREKDPLGEGQPCMWQTRLIKVAARIRQTARRVFVELSGCWPHLETHFAQVSDRVLAFRWPLDPAPS